MITTIIMCAIGLAVIAGSFAHDRDNHPENYTVAKVKTKAKSAVYPVLFFFVVVILILIRTGFFGRHF